MDLSTSLHMQDWQWKSMANKKEDNSHREVKTDRESSGDTKKQRVRAGAGRSTIASCEEEENVGKIFLQQWLHHDEDDNDNDDEGDEDEDEDDKKKLSVRKKILTNLIL